MLKCLLAFYLSFSVCCPHMWWLTVTITETMPICYLFDTDIQLFVEKCSQLYIQNNQILNNTE